MSFWNVSLSYASLTSLAVTKYSSGVVGVRSTLPSRMRNAPAGRGSPRSFVAQWAAVRNWRLPTSVPPQNAS